MLPLNNNVNSDCRVAALPLVDPSSYVLIRKGRTNYRAKSTDLKGLPPQSMRRLREVLDEGRHQLLQPDQAVNILPSYVPLQELRLGLIELCYDGAQVPLIQLLEPPHLRKQQRLNMGRARAYADMPGVPRCMSTDWTYPTMSPSN